MSIYHNQPVITSSSAMQIVRVAIEAASSAGKEVTVAVVTPGGHLVAQWSTDQAGLATREFAFNKAYTSAMTKSSTVDFYNRIKNLPAVLLGMANRDKKIMTFPGGLPIVQDGKMIGAVGVSGGSPEEDIIFAIAGIKSVGIDVSSISGSGVTER